MSRLKGVNGTTQLDASGLPEPALKLILYQNVCLLTPSLFPEQKLLFLMQNGQKQLNKTAPAAKHADFLYFIYRVDDGFNKNVLKSHFSML